METNQCSKESMSLNNSIEDDNKCRITKLTPKSLNFEVQQRMPIRNSIHYSDHPHNPINQHYLRPNTQIQLSQMQKYTPNQRQNTEIQNYSQKMYPKQQAQSLRFTSQNTCQSYISSSTNTNNQKQYKKLKNYSFSNSNNVAKQGITPLQSQKQNTQQNLQQNISLLDIIDSNNQQIASLKQRLEDTQVRMGEQNAYLRECMFKLHDELLFIESNVIVNLKNEIKNLEHSNASLSEQLNNKLEQLHWGQANYQELERILQQLKQTKQIDQFELKQQINNYKNTNKKLIENIETLKQQNTLLIKNISDQKQLNKTLTDDKTVIAKDIQNLKDMQYQLKSNVKKLKQQNQSLNKSIQYYTPKNGLLTCRTTTNETISKVLQSRNKSVRGLPQIYNVEQNSFQGMSPNIYLTKVVEFQQMKTKLQNSNILMTLELSNLTKLCQFFIQSLDKLLDEKIKDKNSISKYKKIVEIAVSNPKQESKTTSFINDLIEKCSLLESSIAEKNNTVQCLKGELSRNQKREKYSPSKFQTNKNNTQKQTDRQKANHHMNQKSNKQTLLDQQMRKYSVSKAQIKQTNGILQRMKQFKPFPFPNQKAKIQEPNNKSMNSSLTKNRNESFAKVKTQQQDYSKSISQAKQQQLSSIQSQSQIYISNNKHIKFQAINSSFQQFNGNLLKSLESNTPQNCNKRRLDSFSRTQLTNQSLLILLSKLVQIGEIMKRNSNYSPILPDNTYVLNYNNNSLLECKIRVLDTPKGSMESIKKYWAPQNIKGQAFDQLSLVWNIGLILREITSPKQNTLCQQSDQFKNPLCQQQNSKINLLIKMMLGPDRKKRYKLSDITRILNSPSL